MGNVSQYITPSDTTRHAAR